MPEPYTFRRVSEKDSVSEIAHLIYSADPFLYRDIFGNESDAAMVLSVLLKEEGNVFSMQNYYVVEEEGKIVGLAALYKNNPQWNEQKIKNAFYHKNIPIPESFQSASSYFKETFNYPRVGVNTCNVVVHEDYRMRGIGDYLVKNLIRISGRSPLELNVLSENETAIRLYQKNGFVIVETFMDYGGYQSPPVECYRMFLNK